MIETVFLMLCTTKIKRIAKLVIEKQSGGCIQRKCRHGILFYSSTCSTNRMQLEVKPCKAEIWKGKNESSMWRQYAELKSGRNNEHEGEMCLQSQMGKKS